MMVGYDTSTISIPWSLKATISYKRNPPQATTYHMFKPMGKNELKNNNKN